MSENKNRLDGVNIIFVSSELDFFIETNKPKEITSCVVESPFFCGSMQFVWEFSDSVRHRLL